MARCMTGHFVFIGYHEAMRGDAMLSEVQFNEKMDKELYHARRDALSEKLMLLQQRCKQEGLPVVILFEGWGSSGKGSRISDLVVDLDPRLFMVHTTEDPIGHENRLPFIGRFWSRIGAHGTMTIFDQAWYEAATRAVIDACVDRKLEIKDFAGLGKKRKARVEPQVLTTVSNFGDSISSIESQLIDDGYLIVKFFLHITQEEQRKRFVNLMLDSETSWRVTPEDIRQVQRYDEYFETFNRLLEMTNSPRAPWTVVPAQEKRDANIKILETLVDSITVALAQRKEAKAEQALRTASKNLRIEQALEGVEAAKDKGPKEQEKAAAALRVARIGDVRNLRSKHNLVSVPSLDDVTYDNKIEDDAEYKKRLNEQQDILSDLQKTLYRRRIPLIIAYEGWDAAGKGGNIKRVARALDARSYAVHPISAPSADELAHPFLWRFWTKIPRSGHIAIFDRTWYGRVMVERIERFAREDEWMRAYDEINDFEEELTRWGAILVKFWIDVSDAEQLRRFQDRQNDPARQWKITDEDWRNREKNDLYRVCVNDMLRLTSTEHAPWHIIESDDKHFARVKAIEIINKTVQAALDEK